MRRRAWLGWVLPVALLAVWELMWHVPGYRFETVSRPVEVVKALAVGLADGSLWLATRETFEAALAGFSIAAIAGIGIGIALGLMPRLERVMAPSIDAMRPVPSVALIPLALMLFGFGVWMEAAVIAFACFWPILLVTIAAVRGIEPRLLEVARVLRMSVVRRTVRIVLPAALARIAVGLRLALAIALVVAVTVEIVLNPRGLGHAMMSSQQALRFDQMYAQLVWIGLMGWAVGAVAQRVLRWPGVSESAGGAR
ncbi:ABC transporter permease subunit [Ramlibacter sp. AW1]|uniref:ABC transporter permease subunit n=1 Tax=Ramlibacter aurantiacus TaxID=2801330 RepID=A0A936ZND3_9BURK|nr:ABC transporter permease subunit [Ramlibacter aurantiacus]MBL0423358.1 ABC transporter permease subunit [Ramlibacter aurantiacus]